MGHGVNDEEMYARLLERWLNERIGDSPRVEVLNLSISGDAPSRRLLRIREQADHFDPDWILTDASALDFALEEAHLTAVLRRNLPVPLPYVQEVLARSGAVAGDDPVTVRLKLKDQIVPLFEGEYEGWGQEARRLGRPISVLILPRADQEIAARVCFSSRGNLRRETDWA